MSDASEDRDYHLDSLTEGDRLLLVYCKELSDELSKMMKSRGFALIALFLSMAALEAKNYGKR